MMKQAFTKLGVFTLLSLLCPAFLYAQVVTDERMFSFEDPQVPECISATRSQLSISDTHYKDGKHSMEWAFNPGAVLELKKDLKFEKKDPTGKDLYLSAFIVWIYNEEPQKATIEFEFLKDGKKCTSFPFGINFKGWRAAWVCYERDMQGTPEEGMNELRIVAPNAKGRLFIDHLITATKVDARQQTADLQVPFVNPETKNHWLVIYKHSLLKPDIELTPVSDKQKEEMQLLEKRFRDMNYTKGKLSDKEVLEENKKAILERFGTIDVLLNAAGGNMPGATIAPDKTVLDLDVDAFRKVVDLNLFGTVLPTMVFVDVMAKNKKGAIVNFCSESALRPLTRVVGYGSAKAAIGNYTRYMATELATKFSPELRVNAIVPGFLLTNQNRALLTNPDGSYTDRAKTIIAHTPCGRFAEPEELFGTIHYLISDASSFVTGALSVVDGGFDAFSI